MKPYEFRRIYHPKLGKLVYQHLGSGIIVDNIFKPIKSVFKKFAKPTAKKALESGVSHAGKKIGETVSQKSGELIMKRLADMKKGKVPSPPKIVEETTGQKAMVPSLPKIAEETTDMILNRLISGSGIKRQTRRTRR